MARQAGLGRSDFIGGQVGQALWHIFAERLNSLS
jgi:hypothetical protein